MKRTELKRGTSTLKRTPLKRGTSVLKRTRFGRVKSRQLADYDIEFEAQRHLVIDRSHGGCEVLYFVAERIKARGGREAMTLEETAAAALMLAVPCTFVGHHVHHRKYRSRRGTNALSNLLHTCLAHHAWIHAAGGRGRPANVLGLSLMNEESEETWI